MTNVAASSKRWLVVGLTLTRFSAFFCRAASCPIWRMLLTCQLPGLHIVRNAQIVAVDPSAYPESLFIFLRSSQTKFIAECIIYGSIVFSPSRSRNLSDCPDDQTVSAS